LFARREEAEKNAQGCGLAEPSASLNLNDVCVDPGRIRAILARAWKGNYSETRRVSVKLARKRGANEKCHLAKALAKLGARITETAIFLLLLEKGGRGNVNKKSRKEMLRRSDDSLWIELSRCERPELRFPFAEKRNILIKRVSSNALETKASAQTDARCTPAIFNYDAWENGEKSTSKRVRERKGRRGWMMEISRCPLRALCDKSPRGIITPRRMLIKPSTRGREFRLIDMRAKSDESSSRELKRRSRSRDVVGDRLQAGVSRGFSSSEQSPHREGRPF